MTMKAIAVTLLTWLASIMLAGAALAQPATSAASESAEAYVLGVGDRLRVLVFGEEQLSGEFQVDSTGRVALPLVGAVQASGLTVARFQSTLEAELRRQQILNEPRVSAEVLNFRPFYILGEVRQPGEYPYSNGLTVLTAVAKAQGFNPLADQTRAMIKRMGANEEIAVSLTEPSPVNPGDTIRIVKGAFYILGEINNPGEFPFTPGLTIDKAIATAGGFTYRANKGRVFIKRQDELEEKGYRWAPSLEIKPGDTIRVGERFF